MVVLGIVLMVIAVGLLVAEAHVPTHGVLGIGGVVALVAGVALAIAGAGAALAVALPVAAVVGGVGAAGLTVAATKAAGARRLAVRSGAEGLVGHLGIMRTPPAPVGQVFVDGALWRARPSELEEPSALGTGEHVIVERVRGLTLSVRRAEEWELEP